MEENAWRKYFVIGILYAGPIILFIIANSIGILVSWQTAIILTIIIVPISIVIALKLEKKTIEPGN